jgi:hypothetical protein
MGQPHLSVPYLTTMSSDSSPVFPPELEREIFKTAAHFHLETILNLLLVSNAPSPPPPLTLLRYFPSMCSRDAVMNKARGRPPRTPLDARRQAHCVEPINFFFHVKSHFFSLF